MFDYQGVLSDEVDMNSSRTFMDHENGIQPPPGKEYCYTMDKSADSDYGSELSNTGNAVFENSSGICPYAIGAHDSLHLLHCLERMVVDSHIKTDSCARFEPTSMSLLVDKHLNQQIARTTSLDASDIQKTDSSSSSSNNSSANLIMSCDKKRESSKNGYTLPRDVEHNGSESRTIIANYPYKSYVFSSMFENHEMPSGTNPSTNPSTTSVDHCTEVQPSPGKQLCYSLGTSVDPDYETESSNSRYPEMFENIGSSEMLPNAERSHDSSSSSGCLQSMQIDSQITKAGCAISFHVEKSSITKSTPLDTLESQETVLSVSFINSSDKIATSCNSDCDEKEVLKNGGLHPNVVGPTESGSQNPNDSAKSDVFRSTFDDQRAFSDEIVMKPSLTSINHDTKILPSQAKQCCNSMDRTGDPENGSELSNAMLPDRFENTGAPDIGSNAEGSHDSSSPFHCLQSMDVDGRMVTAGLDRSKSRSVASLCVNKSLNRGFARSTSLDALGVLGTASSSSNNSSAKIAMTCDLKSPSNKRHEMFKNAHTFPSNFGQERTESKTTNMRKSLNFEDGEELIGATRAKSEPRSMYVAATTEPDIKRSVSMGSLSNLRTEPISSMEIGSDCPMPAQIYQTETTLIGPKIITCVLPSTGYNSKQSTGFIRAKSEPRSSKTYELRPTKTSGLYVDASVNREIMKSISLDMLDATSSGKSCLATPHRSSAIHIQEEDSCTDDWGQTIHTLPDICDIRSQDSTRLLSSAGILNGDEIHGEEEDVKPIIKLEPNDDDYCWGQSIDVPCDELLDHVKEEPSEELRLKNCRVSLEKLPSHVIESCARARLWESKAAVKKRQVRTKLCRNVKPRRRLLQKPVHQVIVKAGLKECRVVLEKLPDYEVFCHENGLKLKECRVVLDKLVTDPTSDFGIQDCRVVLHRLPDYLISSLSSSSSSRSKVVPKKRTCKPSVLPSRRILTTRLRTRTV